MKRPELLLPARDPEVLKEAVIYGADAVYIGGRDFGLRQGAGNTDPSAFLEGIRFAHARGAKVYVTVNAYARNEELPKIRDYLGELRELGPDALIISDPAVFALSREVCPEIDVHISTQANSTNYGTFLFWHRLGAKRVVSARELSLSELRTIRENIPPEMEIEAFVHGAMCVSYSGRCLLSNYLAGRDANRGACAHPCRWEYALMEKTRPGEYLPVEEDGSGTYILSSRDLNMIGHIPELLDAGIDSLKVEGRMKNALYVATVGRAYRKALDDYLKDPELYRANLPYYERETARTTHRPFSTGFYFGQLGPEGQAYGGEAYETGAVYLGTAGRTDEEGRVVITQKNKFMKGDRITVLKPDGQDVRTEVLGIFDKDGNEQPSAPHAGQELHVRLSIAPAEYDILRAEEK